MSNLFRFTACRRLVCESILIVLLASLAGLAVNGRLVWRAFSGQVVSLAAPAPAPGADEVLLPLPVSLEQLRDAASGDLLLIDARDSELYGAGHLPGARNLPWGEVDARLEVFRRTVPVGRSLVTYCSGYSCEDSFFLAERLLAEGYRDVRVFEGGFPEWQDAGLPVEEGQP